MDERRLRHMQPPSERSRQPGRSLPDIDPVKGHQITVKNINKESNRKSPRRQFDRSNVDASTPSPTRNREQGTKTPAIEKKIFDSKKAS